MVNEKGQGRKYLTEKQAAEFLGISERTLRAWRQNWQINNKVDKPRTAYVQGKLVRYEYVEVSGSGRARSAMTASLPMYEGKRE